MPDTVDGFTIDPGDVAAIASIAAQLQAHAPPERLGQFLSDHKAWQRSIPREARPTLAAFMRMRARQAFTPVLITRYLEIVEPLRAAPEWRQMVAWAEYAATLPAAIDRQAA